MSEPGKLQLADGGADPAANASANSYFFYIKNGVAHLKDSSGTVSQVGGLQYIAGTGTGDAIIATFSPALTSYTDGTVLAVKAPAANSITTPTLNANSLGAKTIVKENNTALVVNDILGSNHELILVYNSSLDKFILTNPGQVSLSANVSGVVAAANGGTAQSTYTKGDLIYSSATNTLAKLGIGSNGQILKTISTGIPGWVDHHDPTNIVTFYDDFLGSAQFTGAVNGTGAQAALTASAANGALTSRPGTVVLYAGSTNGSGYATWYCPTAATILFGGAGTVTYETAVKIYALSDGTTRFRTDFGLTDLGVPTGGRTDGIYFSYSDNLNGGNWQFNSTNNSSTTSVDTGIAATTSWTKFKWVLNAAGNSCQAYINDVAVGSAITTNIVTTRGTQINFQVNKTVGTGIAQITTDYVKFQSVLTTAR